MPSDHLIEQLRARRPAALPALATALGRELVGIAYLITQEHDAAELAAARACADLWMEVEATPIVDRDGMHRVVLAHLVDHALAIRDRSRNVDPRLASAAEVRFRELSPTLRAALALVLVANLSLDEVAGILRKERDGIERQLAPLGGREGWEGLRIAIDASLTGLPVHLDADAIRQAIDRAPPQPPRHWRIPAAIAGTAAAALIAWVIATGAGPTPGPPTVVAASASPRPVAPVAEVAPVVAGTESVLPYTISACQIGPAGAPLAFAGWLTKGDLGIGAPDQRDDPAYALITSGQAMRLGTRFSGGSVVSRAGVRLACVFDPNADRYLAVALAGDWSPPIAADGCPASPTGEFGGYREFGGPGAFVLPAVGSSDRVAGDPGVRLLVRVSPPPEVSGEVAATLSNLEGDAVLSTTVEGERVAVRRSPAGGYVWVTGVEVPAPGCWVLNVTVDGEVVGVAAVPFGSAP